MTAGAHSAHRSRSSGPRRGKWRRRRTDLFARAEEESRLAVFSVFAATVAEQRCDVERADAYRIQAMACRRESARLRREAERCRPWWTRPRTAFREWSAGLFTTWSWRPDDPGRRSARPGVEP